MKHTTVYCVILAGGSGTRLWPLSRANKPKQFLSVGSELTLLEQAVARVSLSVPRSNIWVGTTKEYVEKVQECVGGKIGNIVVEPGVRNTGPAILLSCFEIYKKDPDACIVFLPSDPFIPEKDRFVFFLDNAIDYIIKNEKIALLGLKPRYPATGYGYIEYDEHSGKAPFLVKKFHEKPALDIAQQYCKQGNMLWNISMFCGKARVFLEEFKKEASHMFEGVRAYVEGIACYEDVVADSIDYAVMEKSKQVCVFPVDFEWFDVGNVEVFLSLQQGYKPNKSKVVSVDAENNLVNADGKLIALVGVHDLCIVETDDTLLITKRDQAEKVRQVVQKLKTEHL